MQEDNRVIHVLALGAIKNPSRLTAPAKLAAIYRGIFELLEEYAPAACVLEDVFYHKNVRSTLKLGQVRGVCALAAAQKKIPVISYATRRIKKAVVGTGSARKEQVRRMVQSLLNLKEAPSPMDVSDALAAGITFFHDIDRKLEDI